MNNIQHRLRFKDETVKAVRDLSTLVLGNNNQTSPQIRTSVSELLHFHCSFSVFKK